MTKLDPELFPNMAAWAAREGYTDPDQGNIVDEYCLEDFTFRVIEPALERRGVYWQEAKLIAWQHDFGCMDDVSDVAIEWERESCSTT